MPAAAVIPAPIAYIKVVAVKKLVVGSRAPPRTVRLAATTVRVRGPGAPASPRACSSLSAARGRPVYFEKIRVFKAGSFSGLNNGAWNNGIGPRFYFVGLRNPR